MGNEDATAKEAVTIVGEGSALAVANAVEREIQLKGPQDPDKFQMPDGRTLSETRAELYKAHVKEGDEAARAQTNSMREQSIRNDPLYAEGATAVMSGNAVNIVPAPEAAPALAQPTSQPEAEKKEEKSSHTETSDGGEKAGHSFGSES
jgi:hypothetical protein